MVEYYEEEKDKLRVSKNRHIISFLSLFALLVLLFSALFTTYPKMTEKSYEDVINIANEQHEKQYLDYSETEIGLLFKVADSQNQWVYNLISISISGISIIFSIVGSTILLQIYNIKRSIREYDEKIKIQEQP